MKCPACAHPESRVIDSRPSSDGSSIRRRRECLHCQKRFTTYETIETVPITVVKKDKSRESFDRNKVLNSIIRACDKRLVTRGEMVMERLKDVDEVAYVRFASVYRQFKDIDAFLDELNKLLAEKK